MRNVPVPPLLGGLPAAEALNSGYHLAYLIGAGLVLVAIAVAFSVLRARLPEIAPEPLPGPASEEVPAGVGEPAPAVVAAKAERPAFTARPLPAWPTTCATWRCCRPARRCRRAPRPGLSRM